MVDQSLTLPLLNKSWLMEVETIWGNVTASFAKKYPAASGTIALQPLPNLIGKASEERGGNAMGLTAKDPPRFIVEIAFLWKDKAADADVAAVAKEYATKVTARAKTLLAKSKGAGDYFPFFMNDAAADQDVMASYKDAAKFAALQKAIDPNGLMRRTGSFKYNE